MKTRNINKLKNPGTEQYIKDVRSVDCHEEAKNDKAEIKYNDKVQEENKKSQMNAGLDAKRGDSSSPAKAKKKN